MADNYSQLIERISQSAGLNKEEIERKIEAKRAKLSGLVSKEGAAQIVAAELGLNFDKERMKISELLHGMKRANVLAEVIDIFQVREYNKNGREGKVARMLIADETSNVAAVLWDTNHISLIEQEKIKKGDVLEISNGYVRNGEIHLSSFSDIKISKEAIDNVIVNKVFSATNLKDAKPGANLKIRAYILRAFEPRYFEVCPKCRKKVVDGECVQHGKVDSERRALLTLILDDGTESIRGVLFGEQLYKLGLQDDEIFSLEKFNGKRNELIGEEKMFSGVVRSNKLYNTAELNVEHVEDVNPNNLITELEGKR